MVFVSASTCVRLRTRQVLERRVLTLLDLVAGPKHPPRCPGTFHVAYVLRTAPKNVYDPLLPFPSAPDSLRSNFTRAATSEVVDIDLSYKQNHHPTRRAFVYPRLGTPLRCTYADCLEAGSIASYDVLGGSVVDR